MDFIFLLIGFIIAIGMAIAAFMSNFRFLVSMIAGVVWIGFGLLLLDLDLVMPICCIGMGLYMMIRSVIS